MNNKLCMIAWVYGRKYQGWIPIYIYSIKKNYPAYHVRIYLDTFLNREIKNIINKYFNFGEISIVENCTKKFKLNGFTPMEKRCYRWLINDPFVTDNFQYAYIGDIDIYIEKEKEELMQQHINNMSEQHIIYSNALRLSLKDFVLRKDIKGRKLLFRLTGLHFVKTKDYFRKVKKAQKIIMRYLALSHKKSFLHKKFFSDDERCLWLLLKISGIKLPNGSYELQDNVFRPIHGLHFAIGREFDTYKTIISKNTKKNGLKEYYDQFVIEYNEDQKLRSLIWNSPAYIVQIIKNTCMFWGDICEKDKIKESKKYK